jgi:hypothetical protein
MIQKSAKSIIRRIKKYKDKRALSPNPPKETLFINRENEILFSHKNSLETILNVIKKNQMALFTEFSGNDKNTLILKQRLNLLKDKFILLLKEKNKKKLKLEEENENFKNEGIEKLFLAYEIVEDKKAKEIKEKDSIYPSEIDKIKLLNFEIENKIKKIDFLIKKKKKMAKQKTLDENQDIEIYCGYKTKTNQKAQDIFSNNIRKLSEEYEEINGQSERNKIEKGLIKNQISYLKNKKEEKKSYRSQSTENIFSKNLDNPNDYDKIKYENPNKLSQDECLLGEDKIKKTRCCSFEQLNKNNIFNEDKDNNKEEEKESFHSSLYSSDFSEENSFVLDIEEEKDDKLASLNQSNDNNNTEYNSDKAMTNNTKTNNFVNEKINQCDNFIFGNVPDKE